MKEIKTTENSIIIDGIEYVKKQLIPKDGEIWYVKVRSENEYVFIARENGYLTGTYATVGINLDFIDTSYYPEMRVVDNDQILILLRATPEQAEFLHFTLAEKGKLWNLEKKVLENISELNEGDLAIAYNENLKKAIIGIYNGTCKDDEYKYKIGEIQYKNVIPFDSLHQYIKLIKS